MNLTAIAMSCVLRPSFALQEVQRARLIVCKQGQLRAKRHPQCREGDLWARQRRLLHNNCGAFHIVTCVAWFCRDAKPCVRNS